MKKVAIIGVRKTALVDGPDPKPKGDWVLVKVQAAPLCTEWKAFEAGGACDQLGHEAAGEVAAVDQPGHVRVGDRVVVMPLAPCGVCALCRQGDYIHCEHSYDFKAVHGSLDGSATVAQYLLKPSWLLLPIPEPMSYERASLACCALGPSFGAFEVMGLSAADTVLITGAGPVGLGAVVNARFRAARVLVAESVPWRIRRAAQMGATVLDPAAGDVVAQVKDLTGGMGVDAALDCSGTVPGERTCIEAARRKGKVAFVGECAEDLPIRVSPDLIRKGLTVIGSWHYNLYGFPAILRVIKESPLIDLLVSHVMPMAAIQEALALCASKQCAKVIVKPWE
jgi:threonine dehydrogenase-like Zn-dependent dehydrogenase